MPPLPSDSDILPALSPIERRRDTNALLDELLQEAKATRTEIKGVRGEVKEVRDILMVSTMERPSVLDTQRKHSAQIDGLENWRDRHECDHKEAERHEPSAPGAAETFLTDVLEGLAGAIGTGIVALIGWGAFHLLTKGP